MAGKVTRTVEARLLALTLKTDGCWLWQGCKLPTGYGQVHLNGKTELVHRVAYELWVGPIPKGKRLDHLCHNRDPECPGGWACPHRACINPADLEPVLQRENLMRSSQSVAAREAAQTHCKRNHPFTPENTRLQVRKGSVSRSCMTCARELRLLRGSA